MMGLGANWQPKLTGIVIFLCEGTALTNVLPEQWAAGLHGFCLLMVAFGFLVVKGHNVTNSALATQAVVVPKDAPPAGTVPVAVTPEGQDNNLVVLPPTAPS